MIIDFVQIQKQKFQVVVNKIMVNPEQYIYFDSVSDFYKAEWLKELPHGSTWAVSGLDDGADEFYIQIQYKDMLFNIESFLDKIVLKFENKIIQLKK
ncbi:hypothetical protein BEN71_14270 [Acinetobacter wuhouensis]|uniref:Uncharacterized protein n=1 Tax=Acinetobacter wuhouensis TaxID=1879050 RepID=A0A385C6A5_9GAMM|nr:hypothetical protein [Acinetobacter wuhouensis]AXQ23169.1 hypothetical protein BEN71_14270 [Acinetobacter wuhouensis]AYO55292.1 hypothetical protein CDG68_17280 [Acinetobacter wuhouensis]